MIRIPALAALALAACAQEPVSTEPVPTKAAPATPTPVATPTPARPVLTPMALGAVRIDAAPPAGFADTGTYDGACRTFASPRFPGVYLIVEDGLTRRISVGSARDGTPSPIRTGRGIGPGSSEAEVRAAYRPLGERGHDYSEPPAKNLVWGEEGVIQAFRFEIGPDGRVADVHAGASPQLGYSEACS